MRATPWVILTLSMLIYCPLCEILFPLRGPFNLWVGVYSVLNKGSSKTDFTEVVEQFFE